MDRVITGEKAADFCLKTKTDSGLKDVCLSHFRGKNLVLLFVPLAFTGVCTDELCSVSQGIGEYSALDATVVGISVDSPFVLEAWAKAENITIPLLSDFNRVCSRAYGCLHEEFLPGVLDYKGVAKRSAFVVDASGYVRYAEILEDPGHLPDFGQIHKTLKSLSE